MERMLAQYSIYNYNVIVNVLLTKFNINTAHYFIFLSENTCKMAG